MIPGDKDHIALCSSTAAMKNLSAANVPKCPLCDVATWGGVHSCDGRNVIQHQENERLKKLHLMRSAEFEIGLRKGLEMARDAVFDLLYKHDDCSANFVLEKAIEDIDGLKT